MNHLVALLVVIIWGNTFVSSKVLLNAGLMPADIFLYRFLMAYVIMLAFSHKRMFARNIKDELTLAGLGLMGGTLYFLTENMALSLSTSANVSILVCTTPLITALILSCFYKSERLNVRQVCGSILSFVGVTLIVLNGQLNLHLNPLGDTLALSAAVTWAFYSLFMRRIMGKYDNDFITRKVFFYGIVTIIPYFLFIELPHWERKILCQTQVFLNLLFLGVIASSCCYLLWNWVMKVIGTTKSANYLYLQSLVTMITASIVLDERITWMAIAGVTILLSGMFMAIRNGKRQPA